MTLGVTKEQRTPFVREKRPSSQIAFGQPNGLAGSAKVFGIVNVNGAKPVRFAQ
jgi:hypothetical protein